MFDPALIDRAARLLIVCRERGVRIAAAESCTGGLVSALMTAIPGSSDVFERGFVTYSNEAKRELLGVSSETLAAFGAVSKRTAREMAEGALRRSPADIAVSVTGVAGPGGGSEEKPVGLVHFACARRDGRVAAAERRFGDIGRHEVRMASVVEAVKLLEQFAVED